MSAGTWSDRYQPWRILNLLIKRMLQMHHAENAISPHDCWESARAVAFFSTTRAINHVTAGCSLYGARA